MFLVFLTGILSIFNIGPNIEPLYTYVSANKISFFIGIALLSSSSVMGCYLIFSILNDKLNSFYKKGIILLIITIISRVFLGGNLLFITASILSVIILVFNNKSYLRD